MTFATDPKPPLMQRLAVRLALVFAVSLLPLCVISGLQSRHLIEEARARSSAALLGEAVQAAGIEARLMRHARVAARTLADLLPGLVDTPVGCITALRRVADQSDGAYSSVVYVPVSGLASCTSSGTAINLSNTDQLQQMIRMRDPDAVLLRKAGAPDQAALAFVHRVTDDAGEIIGYVAISIPHSVLTGEQEVQPGLSHTPTALVTFDADGVVLTAKPGLGATGVLPQDLSLNSLAMNKPRTFIATATDGEDRVFAVFPLVDDKIFAIGSWPTAMAGTVFSLWPSAFFLPALMWLASVLVAVLASERLVTRHIRRLRRSIASFAEGDHRNGDLDLTHASAELRDLADAYVKMTSNILHDEAELESIIHQREVLLREVHHRVKNNLQLISSIINMQLRQSHSPEARTLMKGLQDRVMSLATIHRGLYQTSGLADVRADELLSDIVRQILRMSTGPGKVFDVSTHFDDLRLIPDQAVPLSLLLTEALTNALKYAGNSQTGRPRIAVSLRRQGERDAVLLISNSLAPEDGLAAPEVGTGLGTRLLAAFIEQLGAQSVTTTANGIYELCVVFTVRLLTEGEANSDPMIDTVASPADPAPEVSASEARPLSS